MNRGNKSLNLRTSKVRSMGLLIAKTLYHVQGFTPIIQIFIREDDIQSFLATVMLDIEIVSRELIPI